MLSQYKIINDEVSSEEKLLWSGQPRLGLKLNSRDIFIIPFSLLWSIPVFAMFFSDDFDFLQNAPSLFALFPLIFLIAGSYLVFGRFLHDAWRRSRIVYGLTDKRAIIISGSKIKSMSISASTEVQFKPHKKGRASIQFGPSGSIFSMDFSQQLSMWNGAPFAPTFECIENGDRVYRQIKESMGL